MPKYIKLFDSFIFEAASDPIQTLPETATVKWTNYQTDLRLSSKKFGKLMAVGGEALKKAKFNLSVVLAVSNPTVESELKALGGTPSTTQNGVLKNLPNFEPDYAYNSNYLFTITEADGAAKLDKIANALDGKSSSGTSGTSGTAGTAGDAAARIFGKASAGFDKAMKDAGMVNILGFMKLVNNPAVQLAANNDAKLKKMIDDQGYEKLPDSTRAEMEKKIEPEVRRVLNDLITKEQDPNIKKNIQNLLSGYKPDDYLKKPTAEAPKNA